MVHSGLYDHFFYIVSITHLILKHFIAFQYFLKLVETIASFSLVIMLTAHLISLLSTKIYFFPISIMSETCLTLSRNATLLRLFQSPQAYLSSKRRATNTNPKKIKQL